MYPTVEAEIQFPNIHYGQSRRFSTLVTGTKKRKSHVAKRIASFGGGKRGQKKETSRKEQLIGLGYHRPLLLLPPFLLFANHVSSSSFQGRSGPHSTKGPLLSRGEEERVVVVLGKERKQSCPLFGRTEIRRSGGSLKRRSESMLLFKKFSSSCPLILEVCSTFSPLAFDQNGSYSLSDEPPPPLIKSHLETAKDPKCMGGYMEEDSGIIHCLFFLLFYAVAERVCFLPLLVIRLSRSYRRRGERGERVCGAERKKNPIVAPTQFGRGRGGEAGLGGGPSLPPEGGREEEEEERPYDLTFCDCARDWERRGALYPARRFFIHQLFA